MPKSNLECKFRHDMGVKPQYFLNLEFIYLFKIPILIVSFDLPV